MRFPTTPLRSTQPPVLRLLAIVLSASLLLLQAPGLFAQELDDAEIAHVAVTANQLDIDLAELALERASDPEVIRFAETMVRDHQGVIAEAAALVERLGVTPADNDLSRTLQAQAEEVRTRLSQLRDADFERAYMEHEVAYHEAVIDAVRQVLLPNTSHPDLAGLLEAVLPALEGHLEHAQRVREALEGR